MGRRCQNDLKKMKLIKWTEKVPRSPQMERNCWEGQDSTRVVVPSKKKKFHGISLDTFWADPAFTSVLQAHSLICHLLTKQSRNIHSYVILYDTITDHILNSTQLPLKKSFNPLWGKNVIDKVLNVYYSYFNKCTLWLSSWTYISLYIYTF